MLWRSHTPTGRRNCSSATLSYDIFPCFASTVPSDTAIHPLRTHQGADARLPATMKEVFACLCRA